LLGRDREAIAGLRKALALAPQSPGILERLGNLLLAYGQRDGALECFGRAATAAPDTLAGRLNRGKVLEAEGKRDELEAFLRQTLLRYPDSAEANRFLATILREQGRFDEAIPLLELATEGDATQAATAYYDLANSRKVTPDDAVMVEQMQALLRLETLPSKYRPRVHFGLCKAFDDLGRYEEAMHQFDAANRILCEHRPFDRAKFGADVQRLMHGFCQQSFAEHGALGCASETPVLILGMPRSGTTLVEQIVSSHHQIAGAGELSFWHKAAEEFGRLGEAAMSLEFFARLTADYLAALHRIGPSALRVTDKNPGNFLWIGLFHLAFPRGRIIHCRRNPLDTCLSNYFTNFSSPVPYSYNKGHLVFYYRWYSRLMRHWRDVLPPETMLEVDYEDLVADQEQITRRIIEFLDLDWDDGCLRHESNSNAVKTASMWQARQPVYRSSTQRWRRYEPWLGELRGLLEDPDGSIQPQPVSDNPKIPIARRLREAGRYDEALSALQEALRTDPNDPVIYSDAGAVCLAADRLDLAVDSFERAIGLAPNFAVAHYNLGAALERQSRIDDAVAAHRRAIAFAPDLGEAYSRLGNLLQARGEINDARECFRRASELLTNQSDRDLEEAKLLLSEGRAAEAEALLRRVVEADRSSSLAHAMLGDALSETARFGEAEALLRRAIELDPDRVGAWHNLAIITKFAHGDRSLIERMEELLARPGRSDFDRILLHFALGKAHDDLREYERAIEHFDIGNRLEHARQPFDRDALAASVDEAIGTFTRGFLERHASLGTVSELPLLVLGMPRSGTTLVEQIISAHPRVGAGGELQFWSEQTAQRAEGLATIERVPQAASDYLALLRRIAPDAMRVTDKNPFNFHRIGLVRLALSGARFVHCRRNPIDTCLSIFFTRFASPQPFAYERGDLVFYYRQYERLMTHWRGVVPPERLFEVDYERLATDPEPYTRRLIDFCGLDWDDACLAPERNQRIVRTASVWQARQPIYQSSVARRRNYESWLGELAELHTGDR
jgi:tetratricopeptide (TPR) repeat protein